MITIQNLTFGGTFSYETPNLPPAPEYSLWGMGAETYQFNGNAGSPGSSSPIQIGTAIDWSIISASPQFNGKFSGVKTNGTLWTWGDNSAGALGLGNTTDYSSPKQVGALTTWSKVSAGEAILAIKTDGTMWRFSTSPVQVGSANNWSTVSTTFQHYAAIKTDGTIWTWGASGNQRLGLNGASASEPTQITYIPSGSTTGWTDVVAGREHSLAVNNGYLFAFGYNNLGQLGLGNTSLAYYPTPVGGLNNWSKLSVDRAYASFAVKTDGTMWAWGLNSGNQLGLSDTSHRSSPTQIGSLTNWLNVSAGGYHVAAIKTNGTIWTWGRNTSGELGLNDTTNRNSPVQVGGLTAWSAIASRYSKILAIKTTIY